jgi:DNA-binding PucR family transcriptional regulator
VDPAESWAAVLVPDADGSRRSALLALLSGRRAIVGPARPWSRARSSYLRAIRARTFADTKDRVIDTDEHLVELVLGADADAAADLRRRALAPLAPLGTKTVDRLAETLRSWLLNHGRREAVAAELFVHPQTVRYRMNQVRELYGDSLNDPQTILELTVALGNA